MQQIIGNQLVNPDLHINVNGYPRLVHGKMGQGLYLNGQGQYANLGDHNGTCLGNLDKCRFGAYIGTWIKPGQLQDGVELMNTGHNGVRLWMQNGKLHSSFKTLTREWALSYNQLSQNEWYFLEYSWHPQRGLSMYLNDEMVSHTDNYQQRTTYDFAAAAAQAPFYLGRGSRLTSGGATANMTLDEFEYWYGSREYLLAFGYLQRGMDC